MKASCLILSSSSFLRVIIGDIGRFSPHKIQYEGNKDEPNCLGKQHDFVKPSHCRRVAINSKKFTARWHQDGITVPTKTAEIE